MIHELKSIAALAGRIDRKRLLLALTLLMVAAGSIAAFAPSYPPFMVGRPLIGGVASWCAMASIPCARQPANRARWR